MRALKDNERGDAETEQGRSDRADFTVTVTD